MVNLTFRWPGASEAEFRKEENKCRSHIIQYGSAIMEKKKKRSPFNISIETKMTEMFRVAVLGICTVARPLTDYITEGGLLLRTPGVHLLPPKKMDCVSHSNTCLY